MITMQEQMLDEVIKMRQSTDAAQRHALEAELADRRQHLAAGEASLVKTRERIQELEAQLKEASK